MISEALRAPDLVRDGAADAVCQSAAGIAGEYEGVGERSVWEERARRTRDGELGSLASCWRNAVPTPPTPIIETVSNIYRERERDEAKVELGVCIVWTYR